MPSTTQYLKLLLDCPLVIAAIFASGIGGSFQYGFNVSVMTSPSVFIKELVNETCLQRYGVSLEQRQISLIWSFTVSIFCIGALLGSLVSGLLVSKYGRKKTLLLNNVVPIIGSVFMVTSKTAVSFEMIMVGRLLYGIGIGIGAASQTLYLIECSPKRLRGMVGVTLSTLLSLGKFSGELLGISELLGTRERWPWLLGFNAVAAILQLCTLPFLPESPSFLLLYKGDRPACEEALRRLWGNKDHSREVEEMLQEKVALQNIRSHSVMELIQNRTLRWQLLTIVVFFTTNQFSGISSVYFYSFDVFRAAGMEEHSLRYASLGLGLCELAISVTCFMFIERTGKKVLLVGGYLAMSATLILLTITLNLQDKVSWMPYVSMVLIFLFVIFFSGGPVGVIAPFPSEILTQPYKSAGNTVALILNWTCMFLVGMLFPLIMDKLHYFCFLIFLFFCASCALYVHFNVPETKNLTALEIAAEFRRMHCKSGESQEEKCNEKKAKGDKIVESKL